MKKIILKSLLLLMALCPVATVQAEEVTVTITTDEGFDNSRGIIETMQNNLGKVLSEINLACEQNRPLNVAGLAINDFAKGTLVMLWENIHFYCDDSEVVDRCWPLKNGYMLRQIPLIMNPGEKEFGSGTYQECVVEFDKQGKITDFRFVFDTQLSESMEKCGKVVELERKMQILKYCDRFRTAYCTKDIKFIEQVFSDDALIITGTVVMSKPSDMGPSQAKVEYKQQNKQQYISGLKRAFARNKYIDVKFSEIGEEGAEGGGCGTVTRSANNPNMYGVRLKQEWKSSNYSDTGYIFLLWDFADEQNPVIHVRTWQPEMVGGKQIDKDELFTLSDFDL
jgi:hypothetical protein